MAGTDFGKSLSLTSTYLLGSLSAALLAGSFPLLGSLRRRTLHRGWARQSLSGDQWELEKGQANTPAVKDGAAPSTNPQLTHNPLQYMQPVH